MQHAATSEKNGIRTIVCSGDEPARLSASLVCTMAEARGMVLIQIATAE